MPSIIPGYEYNTHFHRKVSLLIHYKELKFLITKQSFTIFATVKLICFILSLSVLVLSAVPCCADDYCNNELKTEHSCTEHQDRNDCNNCSPFITCGTCIGFTFSKTDYNFHPITRVQSKFIPYQQVFDENYFIEIWQPPKIS